MVQDSIVQENKETRERKRESERDNAGHRGEGKEMKENVAGGGERQNIYRIQKSETALFFCPPST